MNIKNQYDLMNDMIGVLKKHSFDDNLDSEYIQDIHRIIRKQAVRINDSNLPTVKKMSKIKPKDTIDRSQLWKRVQKVKPLKPKIAENSHKPWTKEEVNKLRRLKYEGFRNVYISPKLGRSIESINSKLKEINK